MNGSGSAFAWQDRSSTLTDAGLQQITEGRVTATISFLASDELAGRGTSTPEFDIAAAYVASRFRGAGLTGGAANESFFHEKKMAMVQVPTEGINFRLTSGETIEHYGLLAATGEAVEYEGKIESVDFKNRDESARYDGMVVGGDYSSDAQGPRAISQVVRLANALQGAGARALVIRVAADSPLIAMGQQARAKARPDSPPMRSAIPVLMVSQSADLNAQVTLRLPTIATTEQAMRNVIGVLKGTDESLAAEAILFTAHLDHLGARPGTGDGIFNGADDDASGVTAVLMLADAFGAMPVKPKRSLIFMTYWGEESGLLGSRHYVSEPTWPLEKIVANVNIEMIGRPEPGAHGKIWMTGWNESNLGKVMNEASHAAGYGDIFEHPEFSARLYRASDNWSFVEKGVIAHSFSAGSLHGDYHGPDDEWERLEIPHMTKVIQTLFAASRPLAQGESTPKK